MQILYHRASKITSRKFKNHCKSDKIANLRKGILMSVGSLIIRTADVWLSKNQVLLRKNRPWDFVLYSK